MRGFESLVPDLLFYYKGVQRTERPYIYFRSKLNTRKLLQVYNPIVMDPFQMWRNIYWRNGPFTWVVWTQESHNQRRSRQSGNSQPHLEGQGRPLSSLGKSPYYFWKQRKIKGAAHIKMSTECCSRYSRGTKHLNPMLQTLAFG